MSIDLIPLCTVYGQLLPRMLPDTPQGTRIIFEVVEGRVDGERLRGTAVGSGADWLLLAADGTAQLDVRFTLETHDGALVYVQYNGRSDASQGAGTKPLYVAPRFETGDTRYSWLNVVQAIGKGTFDPNTAEVTYEWYEVQ